MQTFIDYQMDLRDFVFRPSGTTCISDDRALFQTPQSVSLCVYDDRDETRISGSFHVADDDDAPGCTLVDYSDCRRSCVILAAGIPFPMCRIDSKQLNCWFNDVRITK